MPNAHNTAPNDLPTAPLRRRTMLIGLGAVGLSSAALRPSWASDLEPAVTPAARWAARAADGHHGLAYYFEADPPQLLNNTYPVEPGSNHQFHYWWLCHAVDVYLDAYERTGDEMDLAAAIAAAANIIERNNGSLFNEFFDDMLWFALTILRLHDATGDGKYLTQARNLWDHIVAHGWNETHGPSVAWQKGQLDYKNTPSNAPFAILSYRLHRLTGDSVLRQYAEATLTWLQETLVDPDTGFVADGINRNGDGEIDWDWRFTYCQGVYIGALVEAFHTDGDPDHLLEADRTAHWSITELAEDGVFLPEGGGDGGLFKGIHYRYLALLLDQPSALVPSREELSAFIRDSTDALWANGTAPGGLLAGADWSEPTALPVDLSHQLSAVKALEVRAWLEAR